MSAPFLPVVRHWFPELAAALRESRPQILVTVVRVQGSVPRETGARMWVNARQCIDTIGGGNLEWQALERARQWLRQGLSLKQADSRDPERVRGRQLVCASGRREIVRFPLGPRLGQCCGGAVWLMFEWLDSADALWCDHMAQSIRGNQAAVRQLDFTTGSVHCVQPGEYADQAFDGQGACFSDILYSPEPVVVVCGAGHVGQAVVRLLAELPFRVIWLDPREDHFDRAPPVGVQCVVGDADDVIDLPDDAFWLILTHNHALDLRLIEAVLQHRITRFLGMIGSQTKLARFRSRLALRFDASEINRLQCPIGQLPVRSKLPSVIAVSVVAQLLALGERSPQR
jgi:xanthine dehydrogenase accessory factor